MSYGGPFQAVDPILGTTQRVSPQNRALVNDPTRLVGPPFSTALTAGNGTGTSPQGDLFWNLSTKNNTATTASADTNTSNIQQATLIVPAGDAGADYALVQTVRRARYVTAQMNAWKGVIKLSVPCSNSISYFGALSTKVVPFILTLAPLDGFCFSIAPNNSVSVQAYSNGAVTLNVSSGFNGALGSTYTLADANFHTWEILYRDSSVHFLIDGFLLHTAGPTTTALSPNMNNYSTLAQITTGAEAVGRTMVASYATIERYGQDTTRPQYAYIHGAATTVCKTSAGSLHGIIIGTPTSGSPVTIYDNTAASGTVIAVLSPTTGTVPDDVDFGESGVDFSNGLTVVTTGTTDITVVFD